MNTQKRMLSWRNKKHINMDTNLISSYAMGMVGLAAMQHRRLTIYISHDKMAKHRQDGLDEHFVKTVCVSEDYLQVSVCVRLW